MLSAIACFLQILRVLRHLLAAAQPYVSLLPIGTVAGKLSAPSFFSRIHRRAHGMHFHLENALHSFLNLCLRRLGRHLKDQRVLVLLDGQPFFGDHRTPNDLVCGFHQATSAAFSWRVRRRGMRVAFLAPFSFSFASLCCRLESEFFSVSCNFSMAGCEN